eukprot:14925125-Heterocapsa_arctica.AAC.1
MLSNTKRLKVPPRERKADKLLDRSKWDMKYRSVVTEYCLGCGRETKAKHSTSAKLTCWRRQFCKP